MDYRAHVELVTEPKYLCGVKQISRKTTLKDLAVQLVINGIVTKSHDEMSQKFIQEHTPHPYYLNRPREDSDPKDFPRFQIILVSQVSSAWDSKEAAVVSVRKLFFGFQSKTQQRRKYMAHDDRGRSSGLVEKWLGRPLKEKECTSFGGLEIFDFQSEKTTGLGSIEGSAADSWFSFAGTEVATSPDMPLIGQVQFYVR
jgi:hypothetical protein